MNIGQKKTDILAVLLGGLILAPGMLLLGTCIFLIMAVFDGWILTKLWSWFICPVFSLQAITLLQAVGVTLVVRLLTSSVHPDDQSTKGLIKNWFVRDLLILGMSYLVHRLITG